MNSLKGKHVVVTGGAGFAGSHLVDRLIQEEPRRITVISNFSLGKRENIAEALNRYPVTIMNKDVKDAFYEGFYQGADVVFHLAAIPLLKSIESPGDVFLNMMNATVALLECQRTGDFKTLIQFSSSEVYGPNLWNEPMPETHPTNPTTPYAVAKLAADKLLLSYINAYGVDAAIVRPFNLYGPRQHWGMYAAVIPSTIRKILHGEEVCIDGDGLQTRDFSYVTDVVEAAISVYKNPETKGQAINIGSGRELTIKHVIEFIAGIMGGAKIVYRPDRICQVRNLQADTSLARRLIGYEPQIRFEEGIRETISFYQRLYAGQTEVAERAYC